MKIAIIDCIGLDYDGTTLQKKGIGGSESAIISIARELVKLGLSVTIYNNCNTKDAKPGIYDGVEYRDLYQINTLEKRKYDVVISQRTVIPFAPPEVFDQVRQPYPRDMFEPEWFEHFRDPAIHKILWMQDTFVWGDHLLEDLVREGHINEIFNLSDWHIAYTTNCTHGPRRIYEVLKKHIFHTRNGINRYIDEVDISAKDPNLFVYNASVTKGMIPLVHDVWPKVKARIPEAKLKIVGGYYDFKNEPDSPYKMQWIELTKAVQNDPSIEFTGIIPQPEIAKLLAKASFTIYPGAYPETSGISTLESINYNTPVIGTRFGAMNETGTEYAGYYIDYAIEPNVLAPWINKDLQVEKFVDLVCNAHANKYLHQQKMYACNAVKEVSTWDTIALQWKQHLALKIGNTPMSKEEFDKVDWINYRVHKVFERRFSNECEYDSNQFPSPLTIDSLPQKKPSVAIVDIMGMAYDGSTLDKRGIGGSEAAVIQVSRELVKIGFDVTVYNACMEEDCSDGIYDGVQYFPLEALGNLTHDIVISSRAVTPFVPLHINFEQTLKRKIDRSKLEKLQANAKLKIVWMHDTFCMDGDYIIEDLITHGFIDEVWTLSDFHYNYFQYCSHPRLRIPEVLRNHVWITRNGMRKTDYKFDPTKKNSNLFVFNANRSKGLKPLLNSVWPKVKKKIPNAELVVIGGYYNLGKAYHTNDEAQDFLNLVRPHMEDRSINFTGIISSDEVYKWLEKASYLLYPTDQPETFSISTLEALYHNLTVISTNFAAMEEIGSPEAYQINYSSVPNALKHDIDEESQAEKLADLAYNAWVDSTLVGNCRGTELANLDRIKPIAGWDTVALEWKQHLFSKLGMYLSVSESMRALHTKNEWQKIFGRRTTTPEQWVAPQLVDEKYIIVVSPFYNAKEYLQDCIYSVASQMYSRYIHVLIDDCSTDGSYEEARRVIQNLPKKLRDKFILIQNEENKGAVYNQIRQIRLAATNNDDIIILLDGDDKLVNRPDIFIYYNHLHQRYDFTYGSCWSAADNIPLVGQPYPESVKKSKAYRDHKFNWIVPYTHLRTFKASLITSEGNEKFTDEQGNWFKAGGDLSVFYTALNNCAPSRVYAVPDITCIYNDLNPLNDYKVNSDEQNKTVKYLSKNDTAIELISKEWSELEASIKSHVTNYSICVQAGGHQGLYPKKLSELFDHVFTFEPDKQNYNLLTEKCKSVSNISSYNKALSSFNHRVGIYRPEGANSGQTMIVEGDEIEAITIDSLKLDSCGLIQLDIERHEMFALIGAIETIQKFKPVVILEGPETTNNTCNRILEQLGYEQVARAGYDSVFRYTGAPAPNTKYKDNKLKKILIAIPCKNDIQAETFKSIYNLEVPEGFETEFQYFYGYAVAQVRNLIASWMVNGPYDYLLAVDHDMILPPDTLVKMLAHDKDYVSGVYRQRLEDVHLELYDTNYVRLPTSALTGELIRIGGSGFGCVLVKKEVFQAIPYPQFYYHESIDHSKTFSEDLDFCVKANQKGFDLYADTSILCGHIGERIFTVDLPKNPVQQRLRELSQMDLLPQKHFEGLMSKNYLDIKVVYDIGACVLHWTNKAKLVWPEAKFIAFEAMNECEFLYQENNLPYVAGALLYHTDDVPLEFYQNLEHPGGNSIYRENEKLSPDAKFLFSDDKKVIKKGMKLDTLVDMFNFPYPDLIKMDIQGAELDALKGATEVLKRTKYLILELQKEDYNLHAPKLEEVEAYLKTQGFSRHGVIHAGQYDADYFFVHDELVEF